MCIAALHGLSRCALGAGTLAGVEGISRNAYRLPMAAIWPFMQARVRERTRWQLLAVVEHCGVSLI